MFFYNGIFINPKIIKSMSKELFQPGQAFLMSNGVVPLCWNISWIFGEIGLAGEVRPVQRGQERIKEAAKLGFTRAIIPKANQAKQKINGIEIYPVSTLNEAIKLISD